jgi:hypothetical protein
MADNGDREIRSKQILSKVTPSEHTRVREAAASDGRTVSDWIRKMILDRFRNDKETRT